MLDVKKNSTISVETVFKSYLETYEKDMGFEVLLKYVGEFSVNLIRLLADRVEELMSQFGDNRQVTKRMFSIIVEGLQNISIHGGFNENDEQNAFLIILKNQECYRVLFGNIVDPEDRSSLKNYLGNINSHSPEELKSLYLSILKNGYIANKGGAGLGIVTMRLKSSKDIQYRIYELPTKKSFLVLEVELSRN